MLVKRSFVFSIAWLTLCGVLSFYLRDYPLVNVAPLGLAAGLLWLGLAAGPGVAWVLGMVSGLGLILLALWDGVEPWVLCSASLGIVLAVFFPIPWNKTQARAKEEFEGRRKPLETILMGLRESVLNMEKEVEKSEKRSRELDALYYTGREISKLLSLEDTLDFSREVLSDTLTSGASGSPPPFALILLDDESTQWRVGTSEGLDESAINLLEGSLGGGGLVEWVLGQAGPVTIQSCAAEPGLKGVPVPAMVRGFSAMPLVIQDQALGAVLVFNMGEQRLGATEQGNLWILVSQLAIGIEKAKFYDKIARLSITDGLTGLHVHRHFQFRLDEELKRAERYKEELCLMMLDIDHFKLFNDKFGHLAGDQVLRELAERVRQWKRSPDIAARYGGEEFAIILPRTTRAEALDLAEKLRLGVAQLVLSFEGHEARVTISVGVAFFPETALTKKGLIDKADQALYQAKGAGRDRVVACEA